MLLFYTHVFSSIIFNSIATYVHSFPFHFFIIQLHSISTLIYLQYISHMLFPLHFHYTDSFAPLYLHQLIALQHSFSLPFTEVTLTFTEKCCNTLFLYRRYYQLRVFLSQKHSYFLSDSLWPGHRYAHSLFPSHQNEQRHISVHILNKVSWDRSPSATLLISIHVYIQNLHPSSFKASTL